MGDDIAFYFIISIFTTWFAFLLMTMSDMDLRLSGTQFGGVLALNFLFWPITLLFLLYKLLLVFYRLLRAGVTGVRILTRDKRFDNL